MAWLPIAAAVVSTVFQVIGSMKQAKDAKVAGQQQNLNSQYQAKQKEIAAGQQQAAAQRSAAEEHRRARLQTSRALAVAGASGGSLSDPTIMNLIADLEGEGAYRAALDIYQGEDRARQLQAGADASMLEGQIALQGGEQKASAYRTQAIGSAFTGATSLFSKYGGGGPKLAAGAPTGAGAGWAGLDGMDSRFFS